MPAHITPLTRNQLLELEVLLNHLADTIRSISAVPAPPASTASSLSCSTSSSAKPECTHVPSANARHSSGTTCTTTPDDTNPACMESHRHGEGIEHRPVAAASPEAALPGLRAGRPASLLLRRRRGAGAGADGTPAHRSRVTPRGDTAPAVDHAVLHGRFIDVLADRFTADRWRLYDKILYLVWWSHRPACCSSCGMADAWMASAESEAKCAHCGAAAGSTALNDVVQDGMHEEGEEEAHDDAGEEAGEPGESGGGVRGAVGLYMFFYEWLERVGRVMMSPNPTAHTTSPAARGDGWPGERPSASYAACLEEQRSVPAVLPRGEALAAVLRAAYDLTNMLMLPDLVGAGAHDVVRAACLYMSLALHRCSVPFPLFCLASSCHSATATATASSVLQLQWVDVEAYAELIGVALPNFFESAAVATQYLVQVMAGTALRGAAVTGILWHPARVPGRMAYILSLTPKECSHRDRVSVSSHGETNRQGSGHSGGHACDEAESVCQGDAWNRRGGGGDGMTAAGHGPTSRASADCSAAAAGPFLSSTGMPRGLRSRDEACRSPRRLAGLSPEQVGMCVALELARQVDSAPLRTTMGQGDAAAAQAARRIGQWLDALGLYPHRRVYRTHREGADTNTPESRRPTPQGTGDGHLDRATKEEEDIITTTTDGGKRPLLHHPPPNPVDARVACATRSGGGGAAMSASSCNQTGREASSEIDAVQAGRCAAVPDGMTDGDVAWLLGIRDTSCPSPHPSPIEASTSTSTSASTSTSTSACMHDRSVLDYDDEDVVRCGMLAPHSPLAPLGVRLLLLSPCANALLFLLARAYRLPAAELADTALRSGLYRGPGRVQAELHRVLYRGSYASLATGLPLLQRLSPVESPWMSLYRALHSSDRFVVLRVLHQLTESPHHHRRDGHAALGRLLQRLLRRHGAGARYRLWYLWRVVDETERHFHGLYVLTAWHAGDGLVTFTCLRSARKTITLNPHNGTVVLCYVCAKERAVTALRGRVLRGPVEAVVEGGAAKAVMDEVFGSGGAAAAAARAPSASAGAVEERAWGRVVRCMARCDGVRRRMRVPMWASRLDALASIAAAGSAACGGDGALDGGEMDMGVAAPSTARLLRAAVAAPSARRVLAALRRSLFALPSAAMLYGVSESAVVAMFVALVAVCEQLAAGRQTKSWCTEKKSHVGSAGGGGGIDTMAYRTQHDTTRHRFTGHDGVKDSSAYPDEDDRDFRMTRNYLHDRSHPQPNDPIQSRITINYPPCSHHRNSVHDSRTNNTNGSGHGEYPNSCYPTNREDNPHAINGHAGGSVPAAPRHGARPVAPSSSSFTTTSTRRNTMTAHGGGGEGAGGAASVCCGSHPSSSSSSTRPCLRDAAAEENDCPTWVDALLARDCDEEESDWDEEEEEEESSEEEKEDTRMTHTHRHEEDRHTTTANNRNKNFTNHHNSQDNATMVTTHVHWSDKDEFVVGAKHARSTPTRVPARPPGMVHTNNNNKNDYNNHNNNDYNNNNNSDNGSVATPPQRWLSVPPPVTPPRARRVPIQRVALTTATPPSVRPRPSPTFSSASSVSALGSGVRAATLAPPPHRRRSPTRPHRRAQRVAAASASLRDSDAATSSSSSSSSSSSAEDDTIATPSHTNHCHHKHTKGKDHESGKNDTTHHSSDADCVGENDRTVGDDEDCGGRAYRSRAHVSRPCADAAERSMRCDRGVDGEASVWSRHRVREYLRHVAPPPPPYAVVLCYGARYTVRQNRCRCECVAHAWQTHTRAQAEWLVQRVGLPDAEMCRAGLRRMYAFVQSYRRLRRMLWRRVRRGLPLPDTATERGRDAGDEADRGCGDAEAMRGGDGNTNNTNDTLARNNHEDATTATTAAAAAAANHKQTTNGRATEAAAAAHRVCVGEEQEEEEEEQQQHDMKGSMEVHIIDEKAAASVLVLDGSKSDLRTSVPEFAPSLHLSRAVGSDHEDHVREPAASEKALESVDEHERDWERRDSGSEVHATAPKLRRSSARQRRRHEKRDEMKRERYGEGGPLG